MHRVLTIAACVLFCAVGLAQQPVPDGGGQNTQQLAPQDRQWLVYAAHDNQGEIQICILAEKRAQSLAVRAFARLMVDDHVQIESEMAALKPAEARLLPNDVGEDAQKTLNKLQPLQGAEFDREFIKAQIEDHSNDLRKFGDELSSTKDPDIRRFAAVTRPVLQQHLQLAKAVQMQLQGSGQ